MPCHRRLKLARHLVILIVAALHTTAPRESLAAAEIEDVLAAMAATQQRVVERGEYYVRYTFQHRPLHAPQDGDIHAWTAEVVNAKVGTVYYFHFRQTMGDGAADAPAEEWGLWKDGVYRSRKGPLFHIEAAPNGRLFNETHYWRSAYIDVFEELPILVQALEQAFGGKTYSARFDAALPRSVEAFRAEYTVRPEPELLHGVPCAIVERPDRDVLWVDSEHGGLCRKRVVYEPQGYMKTVLEVPDVAEISDGIWLPMTQILTRYNGNDAAKELQREVSDEYTTHVLDIRLDRVDMDGLVVPMVENMYVLDDINHVRYRKAPPDKTPDELADAAVAEAKRDMAAGRPAAKESDPLRRSTVIGLNVLVVIAVLLFYILRRRS